MKRFKDYINEKETYLGLTYAEVVAICKSSKKAVQTKRRK